MFYLLGVGSCLTTKLQLQMLRGCVVVTATVTILMKSKSALKLMSGRCWDTSSQMPSSNPLTHLPKYWPAGRRIFLASHSSSDFFGQEMKPFYHTKRDENYSEYAEIFQPLETPRTCEVLDSSLSPIPRDEAGDFGGLRQSTRNQSTLPHSAPFARFAR